MKPEEIKTQNGADGKLIAAEGKAQLEEEQLSDEQLDKAAGGCIPGPLTKKR
jgi:hypothetical protein